MSARSPFRHSSHHSQRQLQHQPQKHASTLYQPSTNPSTALNSDMDNDDDLLSLGDPSFSSLARAITSTPRKPVGSGSGSPLGGGTLTSPGEPPVFGRDDRDLLLHASDTESLPVMSDDEACRTGFDEFGGPGLADASRGERVRLTRRRMSDFSNVASKAKHNSSTTSASNQTVSYMTRMINDVVGGQLIRLLTGQLRAFAPSASTSASTSSLSQPSTSRTQTPRATHNQHSSLAVAEIALSRNGAPSPSTASSTLVDSLPSTSASIPDSTIKHTSLAGSAKGKQRAPASHAGEVLTLGHFGGRDDYPTHSSSDDEPTAHPARPTSAARVRRSTSPPQESSSSPPRRKLQLHQAGALSSYLESHTPARAFLRPSSRVSANLPPTAAPPTPAAPGAYPPTTRKGRRDPSFLLQSAPPKTPAPASASTGAHTSPADRVHDIFDRVLRGPDGALARSAERRAAMLRQPTPDRPVSATPGRATTTPRAEPKTPHPSGYYNFDSPQPGGGGIGARSPLPARTPRSAGGTRQVTWQDHSRKAEEGEEDDDDEDQVPTSPIGHERETKLARTLRQISQVQTRGPSSRPPQHPPADEIEPERVAATQPPLMRTGYEADREHEPRLARSHEETDESDEEGAFEHRARSERSAIAFAMKSFEHATNREDDDEVSEEMLEEVLVQDEAEADYARSITQPRASSPARSVSPDLPPLPPMHQSPSPQKPPRRPRTPLHSSRDRKLDYLSPPKQQPTDSSPPSLPAARSAAVVASPPRWPKAAPPTSSPRKPSSTRSDSHRVGVPPADLAADKLVKLTASFALAVRDLSASAHVPALSSVLGPSATESDPTSHSILSPLGLPVLPPSSQTHLGELLARRKHDTDVRRQTLEAGMRVLEAEGRHNEDSQQAAQARLVAAGREEREIRARLADAVDAVKRVRTRGDEKVVEVPVLVGHKRGLSARLVLGWFLQFIALWLVFRFANTRANAREPSYSKYLLAPSPGTAGFGYGKQAVRPLLPETLSAFGVGGGVGGGAASGARGLGGARGAEWLARWSPRPVASRAAVGRGGEVPV